MVIKIGMTSNLEKQVAGWAAVAKEQTPFATAVALTRTANDGKKALEAALPSVIDRPTPYTLSGFKLHPATPKMLVAKVDFRDSMGTRGTRARDYLSPQVFGGPRKLKAFERSIQRVGLLPAGMAAVPGAAAKMDPYGNMDRGQIVQLLSYLQAFGEQSKRANMSAKRRASLERGSNRQRGFTYFVGRPGGGRMPLGIWRRHNFGEAGSSISPVVLFVRTPSYRRRLDVRAVTKDVISQRFPIHLKAAMRLAVNTARPPAARTRVL